MYTVNAFLAVLALSGLAAGSPVEVAERQASKLRISESPPLNEACKRGG